MAESEQPGARTSATVLAVGGLIALRLVMLGATPCAALGSYPAFCAAPVRVGPAKRAELARALGLTGEPARTPKGYVYRDAGADLEVYETPGGVSGGFRYRVLTPRPNALDRPLPPHRAAADAQSFLADRGLLPGDASPALIAEAGNDEGKILAVINFSPVALPAPAPRDTIELWIDRRTGQVVALHWRWFEDFAESDVGVARCPEEVHGRVPAFPVEMLEDTIEYGLLLVGGLDARLPGQAEALFVPHYQLGPSVWDRVAIYPRFDPVQP